MENRYMATVRLGPKGQIVIPKEVREMFALGAGDSLLLLADAERGIALQRMEALGALADAIFSGDASPEERRVAEYVKEELAGQ